MRLRLALGMLLLAAVPWAAAEADFQAGNEAYAERDYATAFEQWLPIAEAGDPQAQNNIGFMYRKGRGVRQDEAEAAKWYRRAAEQGFVDAMTNLGFMFDEGRAVNQDFLESYKWFRIAADRGRDEAEAHLEYLRSDFMTADQVAAAEAAAAAWAPTTDPAAIERLVEEQTAFATPDDPRFALVEPGEPRLPTDYQGDVRDFSVGLTVDQLPSDGYLNFACGNNGEPAGTAIGGWSDFASCPADENGWHEVAFNYDDAEAYFEDFEGTAIAGHPILISLLISDDEIVEAIRVFTDPQARAYHKRRARTMERKVIARFGGDVPWNCYDEPLTASEFPVGGISSKTHCVKDLGGRTITMYTQFFHRGAADSQDIANSVQFEIRRTP